MNKALIIARHELLVTLRRRSFQVMTLLLPGLGLIALLGFSVVRERFVTPRGEARLGYVDETGLFTRHQAQPGIAVFVTYNGVATGKQALLAKEVKALYVFPASYLDTGVVVKFTLEGVEMERQLPPELKEFILENLLEGVPPQRAERIALPAVLTTVRLTSSGEPSAIKPERVVFFFGLAVLLMVSLFTSSGFLLQGIGEEKENRIMEVLLSSVSTGQLMVGKILGLGIAGLMQMAVWLVSTLVLSHRASVTILPLSGLAFPGVLGILGLVYFVLGYFLFAALMAAVGSISSTAREGQQITGLFVVPAIVPLYAWPYIVAHPSSPLALFLSLFPLTSPVGMMERIGVGDVPVWEIGASMVLLLASAMAALWATGRLFRAYLLMYGKRPGVWEMWRALRQG